jgi:hypothetical protein
MKNNMKDVVVRKHLMPLALYNLEWDVDCGIRRWSGKKASHVSCHCPFKAWNGNVEYYET